MVTKMPPYAYQIRLYVGYVGLIKITMGVTAWMIFVFCIYDNYISTPISFWHYVLRNIVGGTADATFACIGDILITCIENGSLKEHNWAGTRALWLAVFVIGAIWYPECDLAYYIAHGYLVLDNAPEFTAGEIAVNFFIFFVFHQLIFKMMARLQHAAWADHVIDFQVAAGAFAFYVSFAFPISDLFVDSWVVGVFTGVIAAIAGALVVFIRWMISRKGPEEYTTVQ